MKKIEQAQQIESILRDAKNGKFPHRQFDVTISCADLCRGMGSLVLQVNNTGHGIFRYIQVIQGKRSYVQLGKFAKQGQSGLTLANARQVAFEYGTLAKDGNNVKAYLESQARALMKEQTQQELEANRGTFGQLIGSYIDSMKSNGKRTWARVLEAIEKGVYPVISPDQMAVTVTESQIILLLAKMIERGAAVQSNRLRSYLHAAFKVGLNHDRDPAKQHTKIYFGLQFNPVANIPRQKSAEKVGDRCLDIQELKEVFRLLNGCSHISEFSAKVLQLCFLTGGQRPYELVTVKPAKLGIDNKILEVPSEYSKNKRVHLLPLTDNVLALFTWFYEKSLNKNSSFVIHNRKVVSEHYRTDSLSTALYRFCRKNKIAPFTPRDIRRTCKTLMGSIGISKEFRDRIQNHAFQDVSSIHYDRWTYLPEKKEALEQWEAWCLELVK